MKNDVVPSSGLPDLGDDHPAFARDLAQPDLQDFAPMTGLCGLAARDQLIHTPAGGSSSPDRSGQAAGHPPCPAAPETPWIGGSLGDAAGEVGDRLPAAQQGDAQ